MTTTMTAIREHHMRTPDATELPARPECIFAASLRFRIDRGDRFWRATATSLEELVLHSPTSK